MFDRTITVKAPVIPEPTPHSEAAASLRELRLTYEKAVDRGWSSQASAVLLLMQMVVAPQTIGGTEGEEEAS